MTEQANLALYSLTGLPLVEPGHELSRLLLKSAADNCNGFNSGDVLVVAQKIVSKAEGRYVFLDEVKPGNTAHRYAVLCEKDPALVELILSESNAVVRHRTGVLIVEHKSGIVMANAGIDRSNIEQVDGRERVLLLPVDSDAAAAELRTAISRDSGISPAVVISDSVGRAWRNGTAAIALGAAGLPALDDLRGEPDLFGRPLKVSTVGFADQIASAAALLMGEGAQGIPAVVVRGLNIPHQELPASSLVRASTQDLFR